MYQLFITRAEHDRAIDSNPSFMATKYCNALRIQHMLAGVMVEGGYETVRYLQLISGTNYRMVQLS